MRAVALLVLVSAVSALIPHHHTPLNMRQHKGEMGAACIDGQCQCLHDTRPMRKAIYGLKNRLKTSALSAQHKWKMAHTYDEMTTEDLRQCGSCGFDENKFTTQMTMGMKKSLKNPDMAKFQSRIKRKPIEWKKIYYLNMEGAPSAARQATLLSSLPEWSQGIPVERFQACGRQCAEDSPNLSKYAPKGLAPYVAKLGKRSKWGTVGGFLSHAMLLDKVHKDDPEGEGLYVVLEDDAQLQNNGWKQKVESLIESDKLPEDWDILKIGYWGAVRCQDFINDEVIEARAPGLTEDGQQSFYSGNVAYIVRPKSVPAILEQLRSSELFDVDGAMMSLHSEGVTRDAKGLQNYWSWGSHTYATAKPLVFGGLRHDTLRLLQTSEAVSSEVEEQHVSSEFGAVAFEENPWLDWGDYGAAAFTIGEKGIEKVIAGTSQLFSPTSTSIRKALQDNKNLKLRAEVTHEASHQVNHQAKHKQGQKKADRAHQLGHQMHKLGRMNRDQQKNHH